MNWCQELLTKRYVAGYMDILKTLGRGSRAQPQGRYETLLSGIMLVTLNQVEFQTISAWLVALIKMMSFVNFKMLPYWRNNDIFIYYRLCFINISISIKRLMLEILEEVTLWNFNLLTLWHYDIDIVTQWHCECDTAVVQ